MRQQVTCENLLQALKVAEAVEADTLFQSAVLTSFFFLSLSGWGVLIRLSVSSKRAARRK
jgi:hypothetical protein